MGFNRQQAPQYQSAAAKSKGIGQKQGMQNQQQLAAQRGQGDMANMLRSYMDFNRGGGRQSGSDPRLRNQAGTGQAGNIMGMGQAAAPAQEPNFQRNMADMQRKPPQAQQMGLAQQDANYQQRMAQNPFGQQMQRGGGQMPQQTGQYQGGPLAGQQAQLDSLMQKQMGQNQPMRLDAVGDRSQMQQQMQQGLAQQHNKWNAMPAQEQAKYDQSTQQQMGGRMNDMRYRGGQQTQQQNQMQNQMGQMGGKGGRSQMPQQYNSRASSMQGQMGGKGGRSPTPPQFGNVMGAMGGGSQTPQPMQQASQAPQRQMGGKGGRSRTPSQYRGFGS